MVFEDDVRGSSKYEENFPQKQNRDDQRDASGESFKDKKHGDEDTRGPTDKHKHIERSRHRDEERGRHGEVGRRRMDHEDKEEKRDREKRKEHWRDGNGDNSGLRETRKRSVETEGQRDGNWDKSYRMSSRQEIDIARESDGNKRRVKPDDSAERGSSGDKKRSADRSYVVQDTDTARRGMGDDPSHRKFRGGDYKYLDGKEDHGHRSRDAERDRDHSKRHRDDRWDEDGYIRDRRNQTDKRR